MDQKHLLLATLVACTWRAFGIQTLCPSEYRPFSCTSCIWITEDELPFSQSTCPMSGVILEMEDIQNRTDVLQRYLTVFDKPKIWTGYEFRDGEALIPNTNTTLDLPVMAVETCNECCIAWQLQPFGLIAVDCEQKIPAICTTSQNDRNTSLSSTGSGENDHVLVSVDEVLQPDVESHHVKFGSQVALNCSHENTADVKWYINEEEISSVSTSSSLLEFVFSNAGVYKCEVTDQSENYVKSVRLCGVDSEPGDVESLTATAYSQTELTVTWAPPQFLGTIDPLLLRYNIYYSSQDVIDEKSEVKPVLPQFPNDTVTVQLTSLSKGTTYVIGVVATSTTVPERNEFPRLNIFVSTYGEAPSHSVLGLTLQPSNEGTEALRISWESADLSLPEGPVSFYGVEYRDGQNGLSNTARVRPDSSYFIIYGVENGDAYEVRVAIFVEVTQDPQYNRSQWTDWIGVNDDVYPTTDKGEVKPTTPGGDSDTVRVVVAVVLLPVTVILVLVLLLVTFLCYICYRRKSNSYAVQKVEHIDLMEEKKSTTLL